MFSLVFSLWEGLSRSIEISKDHGVYRKYTVTVGRKPGSQAHYYVHDVHSVTDLLGRLADETMYPRQEASEEGPADSPAAAQ
ncbi:Trehalose-6-P synthase/phosphatase complex synthase subunit, partial [Perkinsus olseni]